MIKIFITKEQLFDLVNCGVTLTFNGVLYQIKGLESTHYGVLVTNNNFETARVVYYYWGKK